MKIQYLLRTIGKPLVKFITKLGELSLFIFNSITSGIKPPYHCKMLFKQMIEIGFYSFPVVGLTTIFAGMVLALQTYSAIGNLGAESAVASVVIVSITRELGPVLAGLMVAGRIGASMAAEIGTMRVTEQIDALRTLSTNPYQYLIWPRILASVLVLPILVFVGDIIGVYGGYVVGVYKLDFNPANYITNTWNSLEMMDVYVGLVKAAAFGFIISLMGCYHGYKSKGGAQGVGAATTNAVVSASILILTFNYVITELFFAK